jgi:hypothetical protein
MGVEIDPLLLRRRNTSINIRWNIFRLSIVFLNIHWGLCVLIHHFFDSPIRSLVWCRVWVIWFFLTDLFPSITTSSLLDGYSLRFIKTIISVICGYRKVWCMYTLYFILLSNISTFFTFRHTKLLRLSSTFISFDIPDVTSSLAVVSSSTLKRGYLILAMNPVQ